MIQQTQLGSERASSRPATVEINRNPPALAVGRFNITINKVDGSVSEHCGLEGRLDPERHLLQLGYLVFDVPIPDGDYGDGELFAVQSATGDYDDGEYDVAEVDG